MLSTYIYRLTSVIDINPPYPLGVVGGYPIKAAKALVVIKKYKFFIRKTNFIRFIIKLGYISIDLKKIKAIVN